MKILKTKDKEEYIRHQLGHIDLNNDYEVSPWNNILFEEKYKPYLSSPILDVGARNGMVLERLKDMGFEATGIEITEAATIAQGRGRNVVMGDIQDKVSATAEAVTGK